MLRMIRMEMVTESFAESLPFKSQEFKEEVQPLIDELMKYRKGDCVDECEHVSDCNKLEDEVDSLKNKLDEAEDLIEELKDQIFELKEEVKTLQEDMFN